MSGPRLKIMFVLAPAAILMLVQSGSANAALASTAPVSSQQPPYGPTPASSATKKAPPKSEDAEGCNVPPPTAEKPEIVVCAIKPDGYRLNPDVMKAKRETRNAGRSVRPGQVPSGNQCATVGPMGCRGVPTINMIAVAATAAKIADRLSKGQEVGSIFETTPQPTEYQLYLEAKKEREEKDAEKLAASARAKAAAAKAAPGAQAKAGSTTTDVKQTE